jgi:hypothetical protein
MLLNKLKMVRITAAVGAVFFVFGGLWLLGQNERKDGRLLSQGEMAAIFGDTAANGMCKAQGACACTRTGTFGGAPNTCQMCENARGDGATTPWSMCCTQDGKSCSEDAGNPCQFLWIYVPDAGGAQQGASCCFPCKANNQFVLGAPQTPCGGRNNADANADGC